MREAVLDVVFRRQAALQAGESVLIHAAAGGSGTAALQLAKNAGARVFATAGTDEKVQLCRDLGADVAINYQEQDFGEVVMAETDNRGVDGTVLQAGRHPRRAAADDQHGLTEAGVHGVHGNEIVTLGFSTRIHGSDDEQLVTDEPLVFPGCDDGTDHSAEDHEKVER